MTWAFLKKKKYILLLVLLLSLPVYELLFIALLADTLNVYIFSGDGIRIKTAWELSILQTISFGSGLYLLKIFYSYIQHKYVYEFTHRIFSRNSHKIFTPFGNPVSASYFTDSFTNRLNIVTTTILHILQAAQSFIIIVLVSAYIFYVDFYSSFIGITSLLTLYLISSLIINRVLDLNSVKLSQLTPQILSGINFEWRNGLALKLQGRNKHQITALDDNHSRYSALYAYNTFLSSNPKVFFEWVFITGILLFINFNRTDPVQLSKLIVIVIATQRILPAVQSIYQAYATYKAARQSLDELRALFRSDDTSGATSINISVENKSLRIEQIQVNLEGKVIVFREVTFDLANQYLLVGQSGSGKTLLLDILSGTRSFEGTIWLDNEKHYVSNGRFLWHDHISIYKPTQSLYDGTVSDNIANTKPELDKLSADIDQLRISNVINKDAATLSLGQLQRVLVLRAISWPAVAFFLDEPTNALDERNSTNLVQLLKSYCSTNFTVVTGHDNSFQDFNVVQIESITS